MKTKAELAEEYATYYYMNTGMRRVTAKSSYIVGWDACEERVMELLRSEEARVKEDLNFDHGMPPKDWADWLEEKLKGGE